MVKEEKNVKHINGEVSFIEYSRNGANWGSKYFDVECRSKIIDSHILHDFFMVDVAQDSLSYNNSYNNLLYDFFEILKKCKTDNDFNEVRIFFEKVSKIGSVGKKFFDTHSRLINKRGLDLIAKVEKDPNWQIFKKRKLEKENEILKRMMGEEDITVKKVRFKELYLEFNKLFDDFCSKSLVDESELKNLYEKYQYLHTNLDTLKGFLDTEQFNEYKDSIEKKINYLRYLSDEIEGLKREWHR